MLLKVRCKRKKCWIRASSIQHFSYCSNGADAPWTAEAVLSGAVGRAAVWPSESSVRLHPSWMTAIRRGILVKRGCGSLALEYDQVGQCRTGVRVDLLQQVQVRGANPKKRKNPADGAGSDLPDSFAFSWPGRPPADRSPGGNNLAQLSNKHRRFASLQLSVERPPKAD